MQATTVTQPDPKPTLTPTPSWQRLLLLAGLLSGFALRLFHLGSESLWYDETVSVMLARQSIPALIAHTAGDIHPPGYYLLLHFWQAIVHPSLAHGLEFLFAWPSLCFGFLLIALLFAVGRKLLDSPTALIGVWLAVVNPFHIWYSQEVRMYTLGALLGLLSLWALIKWRDEEEQSRRRQPWRWLALYAVTAALGLYTLYYFLFVIVALNLIALFVLSNDHPGGGRSPVAQWRRWLLAQIALLTLWIPWLGIFWRQATQPPVPPWRVPWTTVSELSAAIGEGASALLSGQSAPNSNSLLWLVVVAILLLFVLLGYANQKRQRRGLILLTFYVFVPLLLLYVITYFLTPLYHVRYLFTYAPPFLLLVAAAIVAVGRRQHSLASVTFFALLAINGLSLQRFWVDPQFRSDDHRAAVAQLARAWRPGDLILVNAGWAYTAVATYWPTELGSVNDALPPPLAKVARLHDYAQEVDGMTGPPPAGPVIVRTGSIDGAPSLGWGDPQSDFFAVDAEHAAAALLTLSQHYQRFWHYRLYDTVSDPQGQIRAWLAQNSELLLDETVPGRDYLTLQLYQHKQAAPGAPPAAPFDADQAIFAGALHLQAREIMATPLPAGTTLYLSSRWLATGSEDALPPTVSFSLRLYDADGLLYAQQDETPRQPVRSWSTTTPTDWGLALPIPVATPPGQYELRLVVYDQSSGAPLPLAQGTTMLTLGEVAVTAATATPAVRTRLARFDYIDLVQATAPSATSAAQGIVVQLVWRPELSRYRDTYVAVLSLRNATGQVAQQWESVLGGWRYPSGIWPPMIPVRHQQQLALPPTIPAGPYTLSMQVQRQSDGAAIPAAVGWWQQQAEVKIGQVAISAAR